MLSIRLSRVGKKKAPVYRIVVMPKSRDPWAKNIEILGHYDPRKKPREFVVNADRVKHWLGQGAQASDTVWNLLVDEKIIEGEKRGSSHISKKRKTKLDEKAEEKKQKEADAKAAAKEAKEAEEAKVEEPAPAEEPAPEAPAEEAGPEAEAPAEEPKEEAPAEEKPVEEPAA